MKILPVEAVLERAAPSRRTLYQEISENRFPRPMQLTSRRVAWPDAEIDDCIKQRIAARDEAVAE